MDSLWIVLVNASFGTLTALGLGWIGLLIAKGKNQLQLDSEAAVADRIQAALDRKDAAAKAEEVRRVLETSTTASSRQLDAQDVKLDNLAIVARSTHAFVNSLRGEQLLLTKTALRRIADLTSDPIDHDSAVLAQMKYDDHMRSQAAVDAQIGTDAQKRGHSPGEDHAAF